MQCYYWFIVTLIAAVFIADCQYKLIKDAKTKSVKGWAADSLIDRLNPDGADLNFTEKLARFAERMNEQGMMDESGVVLIAMNLKQAQKLKDKAIQAMNQFSDDKTINETANKSDAIPYKSRRRLPVYVSDYYDESMYVNDDEGIMDDWIDSLSYNELVDYYNVLSGDSDIYDDNSDGYDGFDGYYNQFDQDYELDADKSETMKEETHECGASCRISKPFSDGLRKTHCINPTGCSIKCLKDACGMEYVKPKSGVTKYSFQCHECAQSQILLTGKTQGSLSKSKSSETITAQFGCDMQCSPQFIGFYYLHKAEITGKKYPQSSQINIRTVDQVHINIAHDPEPGPYFKDVAIYTVKVKQLTVTVNHKDSFHEILLDVRGVNEKVVVNCNKENTCKSIIVRYQKSRCGSEQTIEIKCDGKDSCTDLQFIHESYVDHCGKKKNCMFQKRYEVIPKITILGVTKNIRIGNNPTDFTNTVVAIATCTTKIAWFDKHEDKNAGVYLSDQPATPSPTRTGSPPPPPPQTPKVICLELTKEIATHVSVLTALKGNNKGHDIKRAVGPGARKTVEGAAAVGGVAGGVLGGIAGFFGGGPMAALAIAGMSGGGIAALIPVIGNEAIEARGRKINKHFRKFRIKWEDVLHDECEKYN